MGVQYDFVSLCTPICSHLRTRCSPRGTVFSSPQHGCGVGSCAEHPVLAMDDVRGWRSGWPHWASNDAIVEHGQRNDGAVGLWPATMMDRPTD